MKYLCSCGNIAFKAYSNLKKGQVPRCSKCQRAYRVENPCLTKSPRNVPKGENSPHWNPNLNEEERSLRRERGSDSKVANFYLQVKRKYSYTCYITGEKGVKLSAHHLYNWEDFPEKRFDLNNGVCIKRPLHRLFHKLYKTPNTPEQFNEFCQRVSYGDLREVINA